MTPDEDRQAQEYFREKKELENPVQKLEGWEHDCGFHTDVESLFVQHVEDCDMVNEPPEPIYRAVLKALRPQNEGL